MRVAFRKFLAFVSLCVVTTPALAGAVDGANFLVPPRDVTLRCVPLRYSFHCSISRMPNPEYDSRCFYVLPNGSALMRNDRRFGFSNGVVEIKVKDGRRISARLTELRSGRHATCAEE